MELSLPRQAPQSIFLNSNFAESSTSSSNALTFSFTQPLTKDGADLKFISLAKFQTFNTFSSISALQGNNKVIVRTYFVNAVTGVSTFYDILLTIPDGHYDINTLLAYLNANGNSQKTITFSGTPPWTTYGATSILYLGFGFNGQNNDALTTPIVGYLPNDDNSKVVLQPNVTQTGNAYFKTYSTGNSIANDPYVYSGVYLIDNEETNGFMNTVGFSSKFIQTPLIAPDTQGFGYAFATNSLPSVQPLLTGPLVINLSGPWMIYMCIDSLSNNSRCNNASMDQLNIVDSIPIDNYYGSFINYNQTFDNYQLLDDLNTSSFRVNFIDQNNKPVDFRGGQWCAVLHLVTKTNARDEIQVPNALPIPAVNAPRQVTNATKTDGGAQNLLTRNVYDLTAGEPTFQQVKRSRGL